MMVVRMKTTGLVKHLRRWGLNVQESEGWRFRGRPYNFYPKGILVHHTASSSGSGNFGSEGIVTFGRSGLPGPLSQFLLGRDGTVKIIAAGYSNHAGYGGPRAGIPANQGNTYTIGIEAENNGIGEPWNPKQLQAYYRLCAALLVWIGERDVDKVFGHKEWTSRKIDPAGINMNTFRANVQKALNAGPVRPTVRLSNLKPRNRAHDVIQVKRRLRKKGIHSGLVTSNYFGIGLRRGYKAWQKRLGYTGADADGIPGRESLEKLGFNVLP